MHGLYGVVWLVSLISLATNAEALLQYTLNNIWTQALYNFRPTERSVILPSIFIPHKTNWLFTSELCTDSTTTSVQPLPWVCYQPFLSGLSIFSTKYYSICVQQLDMFTQFPICFHAHGYDQSGFPHMIQRWQRLQREQINSTKIVAFIGNRTQELLIFALMLWWLS